ncbi:SpoIIE family protein phosphatase [Streptomyces tibetensis]|uniref:SpoIIE family protein phosphatase n=1 Tax=Streptomyces tibetensis TaxID=2382123 RepID=A0ABW6MPE2_9ACTN
MPGHVFLLAQDGQAQCLEAGQGLLLGAGSSTVGSRPNAAQSLPPGSTLHRRPDRKSGSDLDTGLTRLRHHTLTLAHEPLDTLCDQLLDRMPPGNTDDAALLALRMPS